MTKTRPPVGILSYPYFRFLIFPNFLVKSPEEEQGKMSFVGASQDAQKVGIILATELITTQDEYLFISNYKLNIRANG